MSVDIKHAARLAVGRAIASGLMVRPDRCTRCCAASSDLEAHHPDYRLPLAVVWLCVPCHNAVHSAEGREPRAMTRRERVGMGARIAARRQELGLSVREVQERAGLARLATVYEVENGTVEDPRVSTMVALASVLGVSVEWLWLGDGDAAVAA